MDFLRLLSEHKLIVGDGAMGSQLMARGLPPGAAGEIWNVERPDVVEAVHREYVEAGADYVLTNSFAGNGVALAKHKLADRLEEVNTAAVEIARRAAGDKVAVLGGLGSTGELLEPLGEMTESQAREGFAAQVRALADAGVDGFLAETFESSAELRIALSTVREVSDLPLLASMKFNPEPGGTYHSMMGETPEQLVAVAHETSCIAVGTNCGHGIATMVALVAQISALTKLPVLCEPNAGVPALVNGKTVYKDTPAVFRRHLAKLYNAGARIIGGCCGTTGKHIQAVRAFADRLEQGAAP